MATIVPATIKFSEFAEQTAEQDDIIVGLKSGANAQFTYAAAPSDATYILQTSDSDLTNAQAIGDLASGLLAGTTTTGVILSRTLTGTSNEIDVANGDGISGNPTVGISDNPVIPGTAGMSIPAGTTGERVVPTTPNINLRWNTTINAVEYYDHGLVGWEQLAESLPDGPDTSVQYNNGGAFAGSANFTYDGAILSLTGNILNTQSAGTNYFRALHNSGTYGDAAIQSQRASDVDNIGFGLYNPSQKWDIVHIGSASPRFIGFRDVTAGTTPFRIQAGATNAAMIIGSSGAVDVSTVLNVDNLRLDGNTISSTDAAGNIILTPDTTGDLVLDGLNWPQSDGSAGQTLITDGAAQLSWSDAGSVTVPTVDQTVARFNGTTGALEDSGVTIDDSDVMSGITQLNVDNLRADGNTIESTSGALNLTGATDVSITSTSGDINLTAGSGNIVAADNFVAGDPGTEGSGININGTTYDSVFKVSDIGGSNAALGIYHRHSTTLQPLLIGAHSNSDTTAHGTVTSGQSMFTVYGAGWTGSHYDLFGAIDISADTSGTIGATSSPGRIRFQVTPDSSNTPVTALTISNNSNVTFANNAIFATAKGILDGNSNEQLLFTQTASAVNYVNITNAATSGNPVLEATGSDSNVSLKLNGKGTGGVLMGSATTPQPFSSLLGARLVVLSGSGRNPLIAKTFASSANQCAGIFHQSSASPTYDGFRVQTVGTSSTQSIANFLSGTNDATGNGTSRMFIRQDGNVGIGTTSPSSTLEVVGDAQVDNINIDGNTISSTDVNGDLILSPNGTGGVAIGATSSTNILYARGALANPVVSTGGTDTNSVLQLQSTDAAGAGVGPAISFVGTYSGSATRPYCEIAGQRVNAAGTGSGAQGGQLVFKTKNNVGAATMTEQMRITDSGEVWFNTGVSFDSGTNVLSDYEEGTWTVGFEDSSGNASSTTATGNYERFGNTMIVSFALNNIDTTGLTGTDDLRITGLPANPGSLQQGQAVFIINATFSGYVIAYFNSGLSYIRLNDIISASGSANLKVNSITSTTTSIRAVLTYKL